MNDPDKIQYEEIEVNLLKRILKDQGMVFVDMPKNHGKVYVHFLKRMHLIERGDGHKVGKAQKILRAILGIISLPRILMFHSKILELESFRIISRVRCTHEIQESGNYVFIYS